MIGSPCSLYALVVKILVDSFGFLVQHRCLRKKHKCVQRICPAVFNRNKLFA